MRTAAFAMVAVLLVGVSAADEPMASARGKASPEEISAWVKDLDAEAFVTRERAQARLLNAGGAAVPALSKVVDDASVEVRERARRILFQMEASGDEATREAAWAAIRQFAPKELVRVQRERAEHWLATLRKNTERENGEIVELEIFKEQVKGDRLPTNEGLVHLQHLPALKKLAFYTYELDGAQQITDAGLKHVGRLKNLERLYIGGLKVTDEGLASLRGMKSLKMISLGGLKLGRTGFDHLAELPSLEEISINRHVLTKDHLTRLKRFKSLKKLTVYGGSSKADPKINDDWLLHFNGFPHLESLYLQLSNTNVTASGLAKLKLTNTKRLVVSCGGNVSTVDLRGCKGAEFIKLELSRLDDFQGPASLEAFHIKRCKVSDTGLAHLKDIPALRRIRLSSSKISDVGLTHLHPLVQLESLSFESTQINTALMVRLKEFKSLKSLNFSYAGVPGGLTHIREIKSLESVSLRDTGFGDKNAKILEAALPKGTVDWDESYLYAP